MSNLLTLQSTWNNGQSQFYQQVGIFNFTYDLDTAPSASGGNSATYKNSIIAATFIFTNITLSLDVRGENTIIVYALNGAGTDASISLTLRDTAGKAYSLEMRFEDANRQFNNSALSNLVGLMATENATFLNPKMVAPNPGKYALFQQSALDIVSAPNPSSPPNPPSLHIN